MKIFTVLKPIIGMIQAHTTAAVITGVVVVGTTAAVGTTVAVQNHKAAQEPVAVAEASAEDDGWEQIPDGTAPVEDVSPVATVAESSEQDELQEALHSASAGEQISSSWNVKNTGSKSTGTAADSGVVEAAPVAATILAEGTVVPTEQAATATTTAVEKKVIYNQSSSVSYYESSSDDYWDEDDSDNGDSGSDHVGASSSVNAAPVIKVEEKPAETITDYMEELNKAFAYG